MKYVTIVHQGLEWNLTYKSCGGTGIIIYNVFHKHQEREYWLPLSFGFTYKLETEDIQFMDEHETDILRDAAIAVVNSSVWSHVKYKLTSQSATEIVIL